MTKFFLTSLFVFLIVCLKAQTNQELSIKFIKQLERAQFDSCYQAFDTAVSNQINSETLKQIWESIPRFTGDYKGYEDVRVVKKDTSESVLIRCAFEKTKMDLSLSFNAAQKIIGIFFLPPKNAASYELPSYNKSHKYYESKVTVKTGVYELPGILYIPNIIENPPVVILLAGSGPNDKDETIGPNKPLKDLAVGLSSQGIATLRYDKRTLVYGKELDKNKTGINEEVIADALSAIKLVKNNPLTKHSKIYIVGHSLGAMCAPAIAKQSKDVAGIIMLAGNARPLEDLILEQYTYIFGLDSIDKTEQKELEKLKTQINVVKNTKQLKLSAEKDLPLGLPVYYWQSLNNYKQVDVAKKVKQPILVIQGERDYQVTMTDYEIWKNELSSQSKNKFIAFPALNHLFISGDGKSMPAEYEKPGNVNETVIKAIVDFINP